MRPSHRRSLPNSEIVRTEVTCGYPATLDGVNGEQEVLTAPRVLTGDAVVTDGAVVLGDAVVDWVGQAAALPAEYGAAAAGRLSGCDDPARPDRQPRAPGLRRRAGPGRADAGRDRRAAAGADAAQCPGTARRGRDHRPRPGRPGLPLGAGARRHRRGSGPWPAAGRVREPGHRDRRALLVHGRRGGQRRRTAPAGAHAPQARHRPDQGDVHRRVHDQPGRRRGTPSSAPRSWPSSWRRRPGWTSRWPRTRTASRASSGP